MIGTPAPENNRRDENLIAEPRRRRRPGRVESLENLGPAPLHRVAVLSRTVSKPTLDARPAPRIYYAPRRFTDPD